jgi:hypothetical protein
LRRNIFPSQDYWTEWFQEFADIFIRAPTYKVLLLPDIDRLDKSFLIGQMSGTCYCMHEDSPCDIAAIIEKLIDRLTAAVPKWTETEVVS